MAIFNRAGSQWISILGLRRDEARTVFLSFAYFFCLLASYYILRPIRDEMSMQLGQDKIQGNFLSVFLVMLLMVPLFGWITKKYSRAVALPWIYGFFAINLLIFYFFFRATGLQTEWVARIFFVWVSVYNLFVVSVFWSYMADILTTEQSTRLNGLISAGGTLGALTGPLLTAFMVETLGLRNLVLGSSFFVLLAVYCIQRLRHESGTNIASQITAIEAESGFKGSIFSGLQILLRDSYLLGICLFLVAYATLSTFLYGLSVELIPQMYPDPVGRTKFLAQIDLAVNLVALVSQFLLFSPLVRRFGRTAGLLVLPILSLLGFVLFGITASVVVLIIFGVLRRATEYSIAKPTRETLFNVLPPVQKYRAKNVIDTLVHRGGDVFSVSVYSLFQKAGMGPIGFSVVSILISVVWIGNSLWLGRRADQLLVEAQSKANEPGIHL